MASSRRRALIVDGYNVLRSGSRYRVIKGPDYTDDMFNTARERLINDVINFAGRTYEATIVFDGAGNAYSHAEFQKVGHVSVVFSKSGQSADRLIEQLAHDARERGIETLVVTSDAGIQDAVFGGGVDRMSSEGFCQEVSMYYDEVDEEKHPEISQKRTVSERVPADVRAKLECLRESLS